MGDYVHDGISLGTVFAIVISWSLNQSFWWAFFHGFLSWFYVIYWAIFL